MKMYGYKVYNVDEAGNIYPPKYNPYGEPYEMGWTYYAVKSPVYLDKDGHRRVKGGGLGTGPRGKGDNSELQPWFGHHIYPIEFAPLAKQFLCKGKMPKNKYLFLVEFNGDIVYDDKPRTQPLDILPVNGYYMRKWHKSADMGAPYYYITGEVALITKYTHEKWKEMWDAASPDAPLVFED